MLRNVRLKLLPTVFDCLSWSPDGALAVVAGEDVVILVRILLPALAFRSSNPHKVPKFVSTDGSKKRQQFWHTRANTRQLIVKSMDDVIEPAECMVFRPLPLPALKLTPAKQHSCIRSVRSRGPDLRRKSAGRRSALHGIGDVCWLS